MNRPLSVRRAGLAIVALVLSGAWRPRARRPRDPGGVGLLEWPGLDTCGDRDGHGLRGVLARDLHLDRQALRGGPPRDHRRPQLRRVLGVGHPDHLRRPGRRLRVGEREGHGDLTSAGAATAPTTFATNSLTVVVPSANPAQIAGLADLARAGVKVAQSSRPSRAGSRREGSRDRGPDRHAGHPGAGRQVRSHQGPPRRGRRGSGLRHRRGGRGRLGHRGADPAGVNATTAYPSLR